MGFISKREYKKKSFIDNHILCSSNDKICSVEFKKIGLDWYIKSNNKWIVFFSNIKKKILKGTLKKNNYKYKIEPKLKIKKDSISDLYCFSFTMMDSKQSETNIFWFNPTLGIVIVENSEFALIRSDFLKKIKR